MRSILTVGDSEVCKEHLWQQLCVLVALSVHAPCSLCSSLACVHMRMYVLLLVPSFHRMFVLEMTWLTSMKESRTFIVFCAAN